MKKIVKGDTVKVLVGKDNGRTGVVSKVMKNGRVVVDGLNVYRKHQKADAYGKKSAIVDILKSFHPSNLLLVCPACGKSTRVGFEKTKEGRTVRVCKKCGKAIVMKSVNLSVDTGEVKEEKPAKKKTVKKSEKKTKKISSKKAKS
jgi:large subunit ribosomal protein L24